MWRRSSAGGTIYRVERGAWTKPRFPAAADIGALRLRLFAVKDRPCADFPGQRADGSYEDGVVLDLDYWVALPR